MACPPAAKHTNTQTPAATTLGDSFLQLVDAEPSYAYMHGACLQACGARRVLQAYTPAPPLTRLLHLRPRASPFQFQVQGPSAPGLPQQARTEVEGVAHDAHRAPRLAPQHLQAAPAAAHGLHGQQQQQSVARRPVI